MIPSILGFDTGLDGGIAVVRPDGSAAVWAMPATAKGKREYLVGELRVLLEDIRASEGTVSAAVELPQGDLRYGTMATGIKQGRGIGLIEGMLAGMGIPYVLIPATSWTGKLSLHGQDKSAHVALAQRLFPDIARDFSGPRGGARDGLADAVLIAEYERRKQTGTLLGRGRETAASAQVP